MMAIVFGSPEARKVLEADKFYRKNLQEQQEDLRKRINRLQEDIDDLMDEVHQKENRMIDLENELEAIQDKIDSAIAAYGEEAEGW